MLRIATALAASALALSFTVPASGHHRVDAAQPYINACSIAAAAIVGVAPEQVLPGPSFPAARGLEIKLLVGGIPMGCHITNGFTVLGVWYE